MLNWVGQLVEAVQINEQQKMQNITYILENGINESIEAQSKIENKDLSKMIPPWLPHIIEEAKEVAKNISDDDLKDVIEFIEERIVILIFYTIAFPDITSR